MLYAIASYYFNEIGLDYFSPEDEAFLSAEGPTISSSLYLQALNNGSNVFIGFRGVPAYAVKEMAEPSARVILFVRNPLDVLVSRYFQFFKFSAGGHVMSGSNLYNEQMIQSEKDHAHLSLSEAVMRDSVYVLEQLRDLNKLALSLGSKCRVFN